MFRWLTVLVALAAVAVVQIDAVPKAGASVVTNYGATDSGNTVTVGVSTSASLPGSAGAPGSPGSSGGSSSTQQCTYMRVPSAFANALGPGGSLPGAWYFDTCATGTPSFKGVGMVWIRYSHPPTAPTPSVPPAQLASEAASSLSLPAPSMHLDPSPFSVVNFATWLWVDASIWHPYTTSASAGGESVSATATPVSVTWDMGDGSSLTCDGPGTPYDPMLPASIQQTSCSYVYRISSAGQPSPDGNPNDAAFMVSATVTWQVTWSGAGASGTLPDLYTTSTLPVRVEQIEAVEAA